MKEPDFGAGNRMGVTKLSEPMKRSLPFVSVNLIAGLSAILVASGTPAESIAQDASATPKELWVHVSDARLRAKPKIYSSGVADLSFGDKVEVIGAEGDWFKVAVTPKNGGGRVEGFVHQSAVIKQEVVMKARAEDVKIEADATSIVLAGKGFTKEIEDTYSAESDAALNYAAVNCLENLPKCDGKAKPLVTDAQLASFIEEGHLGGDS